MKCEECDSEKAQYRPLLNRRLCPDHYQEALIEIRPSRYVPRRPLPRSYFNDTKNLLHSHS